MQGAEKTCTFSLPFESDKAKAEQLTNRRLTLAVAGTLTVEESKEKAERPLPDRFTGSGFAEAIRLIGLIGKAAEVVRRSE